MMEKREEGRELTVGDRIKIARARAGKSAEWLAKQIGYSQSSISQYERDARPPMPDVLRRIASALGAHEYELISPEYESRFAVGYDAKEACEAQKHAMSEAERNLLLKIYSGLTANARRKAMEYLVDLSKIAEYVIEKEA